MSHKAQGKLPVALHLLSFESKVYLFFYDVAQVSKLKIESNHVVAIEEKLLTGDLSIQHIKPVFITIDMGAAVCGGTSK